MNASCQSLREELLARLEHDNVSAPDSSSVHSVREMLGHVDHCVECRRVMDALQSVDADLAALDPIAPPAALMGAAYARIAATTTREDARTESEIASSAVVLGAVRSVGEGIGVIAKAMKTAALAPASIVDRVWRTILALPRLVAARPMLTSGIAAAVAVVAVGGALATRTGPSRASDATGTTTLDGSPRFFERQEAQAEATTSLDAVALPTDLAARTDEVDGRAGGPGSQAAQAAAVEAMNQSARALGNPSARGNDAINALDNVHEGEGLAHGSGGFGFGLGSARVPQSPAPLAPAPPDHERVPAATTTVDALQRGGATAAAAAPVDEWSAVGTRGLAAATRGRPDGRLAANDPQSGIVTSDDEGAREEGRRRRTATGEPSGQRGLEGIDGQFAALANDRPPGAAEPPAPSGFADRSQVDGLAFQEARGYWANTYVPGDPEVHALRGRLAAARDVEGGLAVAELAVENRQPFDAPARAALGLYLRADRAAVEGRSRVLLEVGMRGSARASGRRPALDIAVVVDGTGISNAAECGRVRDLLEATSRLRNADDRVSVSVAGRSGAVSTPRGELRYGEVALLAQRLCGGSSTSSDEPAITLVEATRAAIASLGTNADATRNGVVWVVAPNLDGGGANLETIAHLGALAGIATSVVELDASTATDTNAVGALVLAGQGRRWLDRTAADSERIVRGELDAASRIVARALRARIRLARGVQLVDVLGSRRLDTVQSNRVREAERSIDMRLARDLGIIADRGEDEDGIQIVIPSFYSDDSHVILLDVVVPGPGPVADVRVRYKDLVWLRNASADASLALPRGNTARGPLERSVIANFIAHQTSTALVSAADHVARGDTAAAMTILRENSTTAAALMDIVGGFERDDGRARDAALTARYLTALSADTAGSRRPVLADSLRYASHRRVGRTTGDE